MRGTHDHTLAADSVTITLVVFAPSQPGFYTNQVRVDPANTIPELIEGNNAAFWTKKLDGNKRRDALVTRALRRAGWRVLRIWEHEQAKKNQARLLSRIRRALR
jgi:hypothetical protein